MDRKANNESPNAQIVRVAEGGAFGALVRPSPPCASLWPASHMAQREAQQHDGCRGQLSPRHEKDAINADGSRPIHRTSKKMAKTRRGNMQHRKLCDQIHGDEYLQGCNMDQTRSTPELGTPSALQLYPPPTFHS